METLMRRHFSMREKSYGGRNQLSLATGLAFNSNNF